LKYLKIRISEFEYPQLTEDCVNDFLKNNSTSMLVDDVLAELVYTESFILEDFIKAEKYLNILQNQYPKENACDNAMFWLAYGYEHSFNDNHKKIAKVKYRDIINKYPTSRFALYAIKRIKRIDK
jgi:outer membrane protein assembly factor BamD (BamD/ComL family)